MGHNYLGTFFASADALLAPGGVMVMQAITTPENRYEEYIGSTDFINTIIFPGTFVVFVRSSDCFFFFCVCDFNASRFPVTLHASPSAFSSFWKSVASTQRFVFCQVNARTKPAPLRSEPSPGLLTISAQLLRSK